jgi:hypothetical protein
VSAGDLSAREALELLRRNPDAFQTADELRELASRVGVESPGRLTVLYSGATAPGVHSSDVVTSMRVAGEDVRIIDRSPAATFMDSPSYRRAVAEAFGVQVSDLRGNSAAGIEARTWLYHPTEGPWADASARFADQTRGEVKLLVNGATPDRVFGATELPRILANPNVTTIEGIPRETLVARQASHGTQAAFEMVVARAHENAGLIRTAVSERGVPLRDDNGRLQLDNRSYFQGSAIEGRVPETQRASRPMAELMDPPSRFALAGQLHLDEVSRASAAGTSWSGPGAVIGGIVGGAAGLVGGQAVADYLDHRSIYRQQDAQGYTYAFDPENPALGWRRTETIDLVGANGRVVEQRREVVASGVLASQLDRQATTVSLDLMLARPPVPRDPYSLPAGPGDASSARETPWQRDPATGEWRRELYTLQATPRGPVPAPAGFVPADPARAAQLDAQSQAILRENVHLAPAAMAARYELAYHDRGWRQHGELPESARTALANDGRLVASDGAEYQRQADGRWERQAYFGLTTADANPRIAAELDATRALLREGLVEHRALMAERPLPVPPTFEEAMTGSVARAYARQGLQPSAESIETMGRAMAADYRARGIDAPFMLQLERDPVTQQYGPDSPMGLYTRGADGDMALRFTMTPAEAREVLAAPRDPLNDVMRSHVHAMDRSLGRTPDEASDRLAAALTAEWRANGLTTTPDGVVLGQKGTKAEAGEYVFAYTGSSERPTDFVGVRTAEAVTTPVDQSLARAQEAVRQQAVEAQQYAMAQQPSRDASARAMG